MLSPSIKVQLEQISEIIHNNLNGITNSVELIINTGDRELLWVIYGEYKSALNDQLNKLSNILNEIIENDIFYINIINKTSFHCKQNALQISKSISSLKNDPDKEIFKNTLKSLLDDLNRLTHMKCKKKVDKSEPTSESWSKQVLTQHPTMSQKSVTNNSDNHLSVLIAYQIDFDEKQNIKELINDFDENLIQTLPTYEQFEWPEHTNTGLKLDEKEAIPHMISHLKNYITNQSYEIKDVSIDPDFQFAIHLEQTTFNGRPDAVIVPKGCFASTYQTRVAFEFKTTQNICKSSEQKKLELIASNIASLHPVLVVQTDLIKFYLLVYYDKKICQLYLEDPKKALEYINYWLNHKCDPSDLFSFMTVDLKHPIYPYAQILTDLRKRDYHFKKLQTLYTNIVQIDWYCVDKTYYLSDEDKHRAKKIMNAFERGHQELKISGRSGKVYKIEVDGIYYALKLHEITQDSDADILTEMHIEKNIYSHLKKKQDGKWPQIYYGGLLFNGRVYAICTNYIIGDCYTQQNFTKLDNKLKKKLKEFCFNTIKELHQLKIAHLDVRAPNFIFTNDSILSII